MGAGKEEIIFINTATITFFCHGIWVATVAMVKPFNKLKMLILFRCCTTFQQIMMTFQSIRMLQIFVVKFICLINNATNQ